MRTVDLPDLGNPVRKIFITIFKGKKKDLNFGVLYLNS
jgi:hypothetical protein